MKLNWDNKFFNAVGKLVDCVWLSILWVICCIPVFTIGASSSALYYSVHKSIRGNRGYTTSNFFSAFKNNFKQATLSGLVWLFVVLVLTGDIAITRQVLQKGSSMGMFFYFFLVLMAMVIGWGCYLFAYIARFENNVKATLKNAVLLELRHLPWSFLIIVLVLISALGIWIAPFAILFWPALLTLVFDYILERIFRKYMSKEDLERELENDQIDKMG